MKKPLWEQLWDDCYANHIRTLEKEIGSNEMKFEYDFAVAKATIELNMDHPLVISTEANLTNNPFFPGITLNDWYELTALATVADETKARFDVLHNKIFAGLAK